MGLFVCLARVIVREWIKIAYRLRSNDRGWENITWLRYWRLRTICKCSNTYWGLTTRQPHAGHGKCSHEDSRGSTQEELRESECGGATDSVSLWGSGLLLSLEYVTFPMNPVGGSIFSFHFCLQILSQVKLMNSGDLWGHIHTSWDGLSATSWCHWERAYLFLLF